MAENEKEAIALFASDDPEARRQAVLLLKDCASRTAVQSIIEAVGDPDWRVRKTAVDALVERDGDLVFEGLYRALFAGDNAGARNSAAEAIVKLGPEAARKLIGRLDEPDADVRRFIVEIIGEVGDASCQGALIGALGDEDPNVRQTAIERLGKMKAVSALDSIVEILGGGDQWLAFTAAAALGELGDKRAVGPLMAAARDPYLREAALDALSLLADESSWTAFEEAMSDPVSVIRETAIKGMARIHKGAADKEELARSLKERAGHDGLDFAVGLLEGEDAGLKTQATYVLGIARYKAAAGPLAGLLLYEETRETAFCALLDIARDGAWPLLPLLTSPEAVIRASAAEALGLAGDPAVGDSLVPLLSDENGHARAAAAAALGRLGDPGAAQALLELLRDEYEDVQEEAIRALGSLKDVRRFAPGSLKGFSQDEDPHFRRNIAALAGLLGGPEAMDILTCLMKDEDAGVRKAAVAALARAGGETLARGIIGAATDEDPEVRLAVAGALAGSGSAEAVEPMMLLLGDVDPWVRAASVSGLARIDAPAALEAVVPLLNDSYGPVRIAVVEALGATRRPEAVKFIKGALNDPAPEIRKTAAKALVNFPGNDLRQELESLLADVDWSVRKAAVDTIGSLGYPGHIKALESVAASDAEEMVRESAEKFLGK